MQADVVVLGSGAAGLTAALCVASAGRKVIVLEHEETIGGTSARSSGTVWVPGNHYLPIAERQSDLSDASLYLRSLVGTLAPPSQWGSFLDNAPLMLADIEQLADLRFPAHHSAPDYRQELPGAAITGRALGPIAVDGRTLGADFLRLATPLPELMLLNGMMITRDEAASLLRVDRSLNALLLAVKLLGRYAKDRLRYSRGTRLVLGNALVAGLLRALLKTGGIVINNVLASTLTTERSRVSGVVCQVESRELVIRATQGVILAGGGFPASSSLRKQYLPEPIACNTPASPGCTGSTIELGLSVGGVLGPSGPDNALWFPSSIGKRQDGSVAVYPHIVLDRAKPGFVALNQAGQRFVNEAVSYHEFVRAMYREHKRTPAIPAWLVCDQRSLRRYGLGMIKPRSVFLSQYVNSGYLIRAVSLEDLAEKTGMPTKGLQDTVARYNEFSLTGIDSDFAKGDNVYDQSNGDPDHVPNPCIGPLRHPPFYAVALHPTPLGTSRGLLADDKARVCDSAGEPIAGLFVCGNDMHSVFGGEYPGAGAQLGQAMTFAWLAAKTITHSAGGVELEQSVTRSVQ